MKHISAVNGPSISKLGSCPWIKKSAYIPIIKTIKHNINVISIIFFIIISSPYLISSKFR